MNFQDYYYAKSLKYEKTMESLSLISNIHSGIRNGLLTISISYVIFTAISNNFIKASINTKISILIAFFFVIIGIIICSFSVNNIYENRYKHPEVYKWIIPHLILLLIFFIILFNRILYHRIINV